MVVWVCMCDGVEGKGEEREKVKEIIMAKMAS